MKNLDPDKLVVPKGLTYRELMTLVVAHGCAGKPLTPEAIVKVIERIVDGIFETSSETRQ